MAEKVKGVCDIVFLIDATGSMSPSINDIKNNIKHFFRTLEQKDANGNAIVKEWRTRVIGYRDFKSDGSEWYVSNPFVTDVSAVEAQIDALQAKGGGDEPESLLDALYKVATWGSTDKGAQDLDPEKWRYRSAAARCVIIFTDASFAEKTSIPEAPGLTWEDIANYAMQERLRISLYAPKMDCHDDLTQIDKCEYMAIPYDPSVKNDAVNKLREFTSNVANFQKTLIQLAKTVSMSGLVDTL
ncbi:MAG: VWA domain-containing protein [Kiritimatiellae bacterium]|nr:VWA domain-containing protein [Kiritimatiellia bacterium]